MLRGFVIVTSEENLDAHWSCKLVRYCVLKGWNLVCAGKMLLIWEITNQHIDHQQL